MASQEKPIILLLHGAWHIPLHYRSLIDGLRKRGYTVLAPALVTTGYDDSINGKTHLDATSQARKLLAPYLDQGRKAVIAAHSFGGMVATQTAFGLSLKDRAAQGLEGGIVGVVYIAALVSPDSVRPPSGEKNPFPEGWTDETKRPMPEGLARELLYDDVDQARLDEALQMLVYQSEASMDPEPTNTATDIQAVKKYVVCTKDKIAPPKKQYEWAAAADAEVAELDCGHSPFLLEKETGMLVDIIEGVACV
ncbi:alpha/beta-hydrolase [Hypomontagnella monticulosa]|nr:alpha/beta-hydrolase [Hypomontagnella monticulosa]